MSNTEIEEFRDVKPSSIRVRGDGFHGPIRFGTDVMVTMVSRSSDSPAFFDDYHLTTAQAESLISDLQSVLAQNSHDSNDKTDGGNVDNE